MFKNKKMISILVIALLAVLLWSVKKTPETLEGTDFNQNGVWDDLEPFIKKYGKTDKQRKALEFEMKSFQEALKNPQLGLLIKEQSAKGMVASSDQMARAGECVDLIFGSDDPGYTVEEIENFVLNNSKRIRAYVKYNSNLSGGIYSLWDYEKQGNPCPF